MKMVICKYCGVSCFWSSFRCWLCNMLRCEIIKEEDKMHPSSMKNMMEFRDKYLVGKSGLSILDVGSRDVCGTYRELFKEHNYVGFDIVPGKNVNVTDWKDVKDNSYDVVISGQAFEHIENDVYVLGEIKRVLKPGSYCCIIAPSKGPKHCLPDYRRYQANDFQILAWQVGLKIIQIRIDYESKSEWDDCILVAMREG